GGGGATDGGGCNPACTAPTPVCLNNSSCVQCSSDSHCSGATPSCDLGSHTCVAADGGTDAGACIEGATQPCYDGPNGTVGVGPCHAGSQQCTNGAWSACANEQLPATESCNNIDDDCNGSVDDG